MLIAIVAPRIGFGLTRIGFGLICCALILHLRPDAVPGGGL
jgi:hypothetical protein